MILEPHSIDVIQEWFRAALVNAEEHFRNGRSARAADEYDRCARLLRKLAETGEARPYIRSLPSIVRVEPEPELPTVTLHIRTRLSDLAGLEDIHRDLVATLRLLACPVPDSVRDFPRPRSILFCGPPGSGKTTTAGAASVEVGYPLIALTLGSVLSQWYGASVRNLEKYFANAAEVARKRRTPVILFLDELEALVPDKDAHEATERIKACLRCLLCGLTGPNSAEFPVILVASTNRPERIDPALLDRFERRYSFPQPSFETIRRLLELRITSAGYGLDSDLSIDALASDFLGLSGRAVERCARQLVESMVLRSNPFLLEMGRPETREIRLTPIDSSDLARVKASLDLEKKEYVTQSNTTHPFAN